MADIKQDLLSLQYSQNFDIQGMQEVNVDLELPPAAASLATVYGVVTDGAVPVADATVKLFDSAGLPYQHTMTDASGAYTLSGIPAGTYSLGAVKDGYLLSDAAGVTLTAGVTTQVNLTCTADASLSLGTIAGVLTVEDPLQGTSTPLSGGKITLQDALGTTLAITYSAADGEFAFYDLADGVYTLLSSAEGYVAASTMTAVIAGGSIANVTMSMTVDSRTYNGTVSGMIRDNTGAAVAGCFVGLYQVVTVAGVSQELLIATTKTNDAGKYLFGGVTGGEYLVKAKLEQ